MIVPKISRMKFDERNSSQGTRSNCGNRNLLGLTLPSTWPSSEGYLRHSLLETVKIET